MQRAPIIIVLLSIASFASAQVGVTNRISISSSGGQTNGGSWAPAMEASGRYVAFQSHANNLVAGDTNGVVDVFVRDRTTGFTTRESVGTAGLQANAISDAPTITPDGRYVVFQSNATNLVANDFNGVTDIFLRDRQTGLTTRISVNGDGTEANAACLYPWISSNGLYVTFFSEASNLVLNDTNNTTDIFRKGLMTGGLVRVSTSQVNVQGDGRSEFASMSGDGRFVVFHSGATSLVPGDANGFWDVFVKDMSTLEVRIASVTSGGVQGNNHSAGAGISETGRYAVFSSDADNLDGNDTNGVKDSFIHDLLTGVTEKISVGHAGIEGNGESIGPVVDQGGRIIAFSSLASNLFGGDSNGTWDVLVRDRLTGTTTFASKNSDGVQGNGESHGPVISASGLHIGFQSLASNLVTGDTNNALDSFVHTRQAWLPPSMYTLFRGIQSSGNINSLLYSDDNRLVLQPGPVFSTSEAPIQLILDAISPFTTCTQFQFEIEWQASSTSIQQHFDLWNFKTSNYTNIAVTQAALTDVTQLINVVPWEDHLGPQGELRARVSYRVTGPVFAYPWQARIDRVRFIISP